MKVCFLVIAFLFCQTSFSQNIGIGTTVPAARLHVTDSSVLFSAPGEISPPWTLPPLQGAGRRMMWYPNKSVFRVGYVNGNQWDEINLGAYSFASGISTIASGDYSTAMGFANIASGAASTAIGFSTTAKAFGGLSIGYLNDISDNPDPSVVNPNDRLFQIGNGFGFTRSNIMTVLRKGFVGIGTFNPDFKLDVRNGSINTDSLYRIGSSPVLAVPGLNNLFAGKDAGYTNTGNNNSFFGQSAGKVNTSGYENSFLGSSAGQNNISGYKNAFYGFRAGMSNNSGFNNSFFGHNAGASNNSYGNSFFGTNAGYSNSIGMSNAFFGMNSGYTNSSGTQNAFFGQSAGYSNTTGESNAFFGPSAGYSNTIGDYNSFSGDLSGYYSTGSSNTVSGYRSAFTLTTGSYNCMFGDKAGYDITTGSFNTMLGFGARGPAAVTNSMSLGNEAIVSASNQVRIGNIAITSIGGQVGWTTFSDGRFKAQVVEDIPGLLFIKKLRPVTYLVDIKKLNDHYAPYKTALNNDLPLPKSDRQSGFLAQEVEQAANEIGYSFSGVDKPQNDKALYGLRYAEFVVPLVKAVQEQQTIIETLQKQVEAAKAEIPVVIGKQQKMIDQQNIKIEMLIKELTHIKEKLK